MLIRNSKFVIRNCPALVAANRELIARFEKKIQATLTRVWGEAAPAVSTTVSAHEPALIQDELI